MVHEVLGMHHQCAFDWLVRVRWHSQPCHDWRCWYEGKVFWLDRAMLQSLQNSIHGHQALAIRRAADAERCEQLQLSTGTHS
jgi:hypothetical protein